MDSDSTGLELTSVLSSVLTGRVSRQSEQANVCIESMSMIVSYHTTPFCNWLRFKDSSGILNEVKPKELVYV